MKSTVNQICIYELLILDISHDRLQRTPPLLVILILDLFVVIVIFGSTLVRLLTVHLSLASVALHIVKNYPVLHV